MALIAWLEHGDAVALSRNGEATVALLVGEDTVTLAKAGAEHTASAETSRQRAFMRGFTRFQVRRRLARSWLARSLSGPMRESAWKPPQPLERSTRSATSGFC